MNLEYSCFVDLNEGGCGYMDVIFQQKIVNMFLQVVGYLFMPLSCHSLKMYNVVICRL